jgi:hypothetical protein
VATNLKPTTQKQNQTTAEIREKYVSVQTSQSSLQKKQAL